MDVEMQNTLLRISDELCEKDISAMIFLCGKYLKEGDKENIKDGKTLFSILKKRGYLSKDNLLFLKELLSRIGRKDILTDELKATKTEMEELERSFQHISPYRSILYDISVNLNSEETEKIMFLLEAEIRNIHTLNKAKCMMVVLSEMEKQRKLSEDCLQKLNTYLLGIQRLDLSGKIKKFEYEQDNRRPVLDTEFEKLGIQERSCGDDKVSSIQPDLQNDPSLKDNQLEEYKLDKSPHGLCIIVNNFDFSKVWSLNDRKGTQNDAEALNIIFSSRGYNVKQHNDLTGEEMLNIMKLYAGEDHTEKDSLVCFVLSHGNKGTVCGTDGKDVSVKDLTDCFNGRNCSSLIGKPKVFFIQACQGDQSDEGVSYVSDSTPSAYVNDAPDLRLPTSADFLTAFASVADYVSFRNQTTGSVYIQELCTVLQDHRFLKTDLISILTKVQARIADESYQVKKNGEKLKVKQMPTYKSELRKTLILPPPHEQQASCLPFI
ncbi:caspase-3-like [Rhinoderma darwinii]|uniref:caspase-3-like n=1 Tax=Rhinoderma darwinii TaxID=43563 RepID=UPI003F679FC7